MGRGKQDEPRFLPFGELNRLLNNLTTVTPSGSWLAAQLPE